MSLILAAIAPIPVLSSITGLFYRNPHRLKAMTAVLAVLLVVIALDTLRTWLAPVAARICSGLRGALARTGLADSTISMVTRAAAAVVVVILCTPAMVVGSQAIASDVREGYQPVLGDTRFIADEAELAMIRRLPDELPDDAVVIGDPVAGAGYIPILTGMRSVWVFPGQAADDEDGIYLREYFNQIHTDPHVCEILQHHGIKYFYADKDIRFNNSQLSKIRPGLYKVDTSYGFTLRGHHRWRPTATVLLMNGIPANRAARCLHRGLRSPSRTYFSRRRLWPDHSCLRESAVLDR